MPTCGRGPTGTVWHEKSHQVMEAAGTEDADQEGNHQRHRFLVSANLPDLSLVKRAWPTDAALLARSASSLQAVASVLGRQRSEMMRVYFFRCWFWLSICAFDLVLLWVQAVSLVRPFSVLGKKVGDAALGGEGRVSVDRTLQSHQLHNRGRKWDSQKRHHKY